VLSTLQIYKPFFSAMGDHKPLYVWQFGHAVIGFTFFIKLVGWKLSAQLLKHFGGIKREAYL